MNAKAKQDALFEKIRSSPEPPVPYPDAKKLIAYGKEMDYSSLLNYVEDLQPAGRDKVICSAGGAMAMVRFEWLPNAINYFSGMFRLADHGLIRCTSVNEPKQASTGGWSTMPTPTMVPMVALKFFRDGESPSGNVVLAYKKSGQHESNFLAHAVSNHFTENVKFPFTAALKVFKKYSDFPTFSGLAEFASIDQDGKAVEKPVAPYALVLLPPKALRERKTEITQQLCDQFSSLVVGEVLYEAYAVIDPIATSQNASSKQVCTAGKIADCPVAPSIWRVGALRLTSPFISSSFGDKQLFFRHQLFDGDLQLRPDWKVRVDTMVGAPFYEALIDGGDCWDPSASTPNLAFDDEAMTQRATLVRRQTEVMDGEEQENMGKVATEVMPEEVALLGASREAAEASELPVGAVVEEAAVGVGAGRCPFLSSVAFRVSACCSPDPSPPDDSDSGNELPDVVDGACGDGNSAGVVVFVVSGCPHCRRVESILDGLGWNYVCISLSDYPEKRMDMLQLTNRCTVPQVFFNSRHIGGAAEFEALIAGIPDPAALHAEILNEGPGPNAVLLQKPIHSPRASVAPSPHEDPILCVSGESLTYRDLQALCEAGVNVKDRKRRMGMQTFKKCFTGHDLVDFLMKQFRLNSRPDAVQLASQLFFSCFFNEVDGTRLFQDNDRLYRFQFHEVGLWKALNVQRIWCPPDGCISSTVERPLATLRRLSDALSDICKAHTNSQGLVDYQAVAEDPRTAEFDHAACELQLVSLPALEPATRAAFVINLYNMAVTHAVAVLGAPSDHGARLAFFNGVRYQLERHCYSMNDLESGVLRGNRHPPYQLRKPFHGGDGRLEAVLPLDHRVHFALNCGARSCPMVQWYTAERLREDLDLAARAWVEQDENVFVDTARRTLFLSKICKWYESDFGANRAAVARTILSHSRGEKSKQISSLLSLKRFDLKYLPYDWSLSGLRAKPFLVHSYRSMAH